MLGGPVGGRDDLDHQLLHGDFRGGDGQQLPAGTRPYILMSSLDMSGFNN